MQLRERVVRQREGRVLLDGAPVPRLRGCEVAARVQHARHVEAALRAHARVPAEPQRLLRRLEGGAEVAELDGRRGALRRRAAPARHAQAEGVAAALHGGNRRLPGAVEEEAVAAAQRRRRGGALAAAGGREDDVAAGADRRGEVAERHPSEEVRVRGVVEEPRGAAERHVVRDADHARAGAQAAHALRRAERVPRAPQLQQRVEEERVRVARLELQRAPRGHLRPLEVAGALRGGGDAEVDGRVRARVQPQGAQEALERRRRVALVEERDAVADERRDRLAALEHLAEEPAGLGHEERALPLVRLRRAEAEHAARELHEPLGLDPVRAAVREPLGAADGLLRAAQVRPLPLAVLRRAALVALDRVAAAQLHLERGQRDGDARLAVEDHLPADAARQEELIDVVPVVVHEPQDVRRVARAAASPEHHGEVEPDGQRRHLADQQLLDLGHLGQLVRVDLADAHLATQRAAQRRLEDARHSGQRGCVLAAGGGLRVLAAAAAGRGRSGREGGAARAVLLDLGTWVAGGRPVRAGWTVALRRPNGTGWAGGKPRWRSPKKSQVWSAGNSQILDSVVRSPAAHALRGGEGAVPIFAGRGQGVGAPRAGAGRLQDGTPCRACQRGTSWDCARAPHSSGRGG